MQPCLFCSGDRSEPDHDRRCDGRQGRREAAIPAFDYDPIGHARTEDPDTSHAAAASNESGKKTQCNMIYRLIHDAQSGATCAELVTVTGWEHQSVSRRITDICQQGFVRDSGTRRVSPRSGKKQIVWVAVDSVAS